MISRRRFIRRMVRHGLVAGGLVGLMLGIGAVGYHTLAGLEWIDAIYNAAMILTGMGPVAHLQTDGAKLFASGYALFSGVVFLSAAALLVSPALHRLLHALHIEEERWKD